MKHLNLIQMIVTKGVCIYVGVCVTVCTCTSCMYVCICVRHVCLCVHVRVSRNSTIFNDAFQMCYKFTCIYVYLNGFHIIIID